MAIRYLTIIIQTLCILGFAQAGFSAAYPETVEIGLDAGYRQDRLNWRISDQLPGTDDTIRSELRWEDLRSNQLRLRGRLIVGGLPGNWRPYLRGSFNYGQLHDGHSRDSDYFVTDQSREFSRSISLTQGDYLLDGLAGAGLQWRTAGQGLAVALLGGYSHNEQKLRLTDGRQVISAPEHAPPGGRPLQPGPFAGLDSNYHARWRGPWLGVDLDISLAERLSLTGWIAYHWSRLEAAGRWNLRQDLAQPVSFQHQSGGAKGLAGEAMIRYSLSENWALMIAAQYQELQADGGTDTVYFTDGSTTTIRLERVHWQTVSGSLGITYSF